MENFCPRCGTSRIGAFRYCRSCRFDFDTLVDAPIGEPASLPVAAAVRARVVAAGRSARGYSGQSLLGMGVLMLVGIAALGGIQRIDPEIVSSGATPTQEARALAEADATPAAPNRQAAEPSTAVAVAEATPPTWLVQQRGHWPGARQELPSAGRSLHPIAPSPCCTGRVRPGAGRGCRVLTRY